MSSVIASIDSSDARCAADGGTDRFIAAARSALARAGSRAPERLDGRHTASSTSEPSSQASATSWRRARADRADGEVRGLDVGLHEVGELRVHLRGAAG